MSRLLICPCLFVLLGLPAALQGGGKHPAEEVVVKMIGQLEKMADTLGSMKDEDSVAAAREPLRKQLAAFRELRAEADKLPPPPREVKDRLAKEYRKKVVEVQERLMLEVVRVRTSVPTGRNAVTEISAVLRGEEGKLKTPRVVEKDEKEKKDEKK